MPCPTSVDGNGSTDGADPPQPHRFTWNGYRTQPRFAPTENTAGLERLHHRRPVRFYQCGFGFCDYYINLFLSNQVLVAVVGVRSVPLEREGCGGSEFLRSGVLVAYIRQRPVRIR